MKRTAYLRLGCSPQSNWRFYSPPLLQSSHLPRLPLPLLQLCCHSTQLRKLLQHCWWRLQLAFACCLCSVHIWNLSRTFSCCRSNSIPIMSEGELKLSWKKVHYFFCDKVRKILHIGLSVTPSQTDSADKYTVDACSAAVTDPSATDAATCSPLNRSCHDRKSKNSINSSRNTIVGLNSNRHTKETIPIARHTASQQNSSNSLVWTESQHQDR